MQGHAPWIALLLALASQLALATTDLPASDARPAELIAAMDEGDLKQRLQQCAPGSLARHPFVIGHRGAPRAFPEHSRESYLAAEAQGAAILECDVSFTADLQLVCRHSQCDLHTTTNILDTALAGNCSVGFTPADPIRGTPASAHCCTSDISLAEFRSLCGRMDAVDTSAESVAQYLAPGGTACGTLMSHRDSIALFDQLGVGMTPELKAAQVTMPFRDGFTQQHYARQMIEEYRAAGIPASRVWPQSFALADIELWLHEYPEFGAQAIYLDDRYEQPGFDPRDASTWQPGMQELRQRGVRILGAPIPFLLDLQQGRIVASPYATSARAAGIELIAWTIERSGDLENGGGFYHSSIASAVRGKGDLYPVLDALARKARVRAVFSDWPATVSYYANCMAGTESHTGSGSIGNAD